MDDDDDDYYQIFSVQLCSANDIVICHFTHLGWPHRPEDPLGLCGSVHNFQWRIETEFYHKSLATMSKTRHGHETVIGRLTNRQAN